MTPARCRTRVHAPPPSRWPWRLVQAGLLCASWSGLAWAASTTPTGLPPAVASALQASGVPPEAVSLLVLPVEGGPARLVHEADAVRQVASVMKLFTTGVALSTLGPAHTWRTDVALGGPLRPNGTLDGPLYIKGQGDPSLVVEKLQLMMSRWRAAGLKDIRGDLLLDRQVFDLPQHDPAAFDGQGLKPYNAGPDALLLNYQSVSLRLAPDAARPHFARVTMEPELDGVRLDAQVRLVEASACGDWREALDLRIEPAPRLRAGQASRWTITLRGPYARACETREWPLLWQGDGPGDHAARLLRHTWREAGGRLRGEVKAGVWPEHAQVWQSWVSPPLGVVVRDINKFSNNVMARQLFLSLAPGTGPDTPAQARQAIGQQVQASTRDASGTSPCHEGTLLLDNGSGLSRNERSSAWCLGRWMQAMWASPVMPELLASLPVTGMDGTARRLTSLSGRAHIKTGSLDGVAALAGVVDGDSGRRYVVVGVVNHPQADAARPALEAMMLWAQKDRPPQN